MDIQCSKCGNKMQPGFLLDHTFGGRLTSKWVAGHPEKTVFSKTVWLEGKKQLEVLTYRCINAVFWNLTLTSDDFLRFYALSARPEPAPKFPDTCPRKNCTECQKLFTPNLNIFGFSVF